MIEKGMLIKKEKVKKEERGYGKGRKGCGMGKNELVKGEN